MIAEVDSLCLVLLYSNGLCLDPVEDAIGVESVVAGRKNDLLALDEVLHTNRAAVIEKTTDVDVVEVPSRLQGYSLPTLNIEFVTLELLVYLCDQKLDRLQIPVINWLQHLQQ